MANQQDRVPKHSAITGDDADGKIQDKDFYSNEV